MNRTTPKNTTMVTMRYDHLETGAPGCNLWRKGDRFKGVIEGDRFFHYFPDGGNWSTPLSEVIVSGSRQRRTLVAKVLIWFTRDLSTTPERARR